MQTAFRDLCDLCEKLEGTTKRLVMVDLVANFLKGLQPEEVDSTVSTILGRPFPKWDQRVLEVSWATLSSLITHLTNVNRRDFQHAFSQTGDIGSATKTILETSNI